MSDQHDPTTDEREATYAQIDRLAQAHAVARAIEEVTPAIIRAVFTKIPAVALRRALARVIGRDGTIHPTDEDYAAARRDASEL